MEQDPKSVGEILDGVEELAERGDSVCVGDLLDEYGSRSFGPVIIVLALLEVSPLGAIPLVPTIIAALIALIALQQVFGREHVWVPRFVENRAIKSKRLIDGADKLEKVAAVLDSLSGDRLRYLTRQPVPRIAGLIVIMLCLTVPPLEFIPFASTAPMLAIAVIGLALVTRDGLLMMIAFVLTAAAITAGTAYYLGSP